MIQRSIQIGLIKPLSMKRGMGEWFRNWFGTPQVSKLGWEKSQEILHKKKTIYKEGICIKVGFLSIFFFYIPNICMDSYVTCYLYFMAHGDYLNIEYANTCALKLSYSRSVIKFVT